MTGAACGSCAAGQRRAMTEHAYIGHVSGALVAGRVGIVRAPRFRVRGVGDMAATTLTPGNNVSPRHIESRVAARSTGRRIRMASLAVGQVSLCCCPVDRGSSERQCMARDL